MTVTIPTQQTICNLNGIRSDGEPVYKIGSLRLWPLRKCFKDKRA